MEIFKDDGRVYDWVVQKLDNGESYRNDLTIGIRNDKLELIAGIIYSVVGDITYLSIYATDPKWCSSSHLTKIFKLPFEVFESKIVKCITDSKNKKVNKLLWGLKLKEEGLLRFARANGSHERVFSLTEKELKTKRWYKCQA